MKVFKYPLEIRDEQRIAMPYVATIISAQAQHGILCLWAVVDETAPPTERTIDILGTGHHMEGDRFMGDKRKFIGTVQMMSGALVWHVFERI